MSTIRPPRRGAYFQDWDGEGVLWNPNTNITSRYTVGCPTELFVDLMANSDFRQMFADHVYKDLTTVLSAANATALYQRWPIRSARPSFDELPAGATSPR